jgi:DNA-binding CsgD family transcriptional regulator
MAALDQLSGREQEVVRLVLEGKSNKQIAAALHISERTVEFHLTNIYSKLEVSSRTELMVKLGESTVAGKGQAADDRDRLNVRHWAASLRDAVFRIGRELKVENSLNSSGAGSSAGGAGSMTFFEAIRVCFIKYADFTGRASRSEIWWFMLFVVLAASALVYVSEAVSSVFLIAVTLPLLAVGARRLRDSGKSPWWLAFLLVPVAGIIMLGFMWAEPPANPQTDDTLAG